MTPESFEPQTAASDLRDSVLVIVKFLLSNKRVHEKHRTRLLDRCLWQLTEAEGKHKYDLRYVSVEAIPVLESGEKKGLRHEHVWRRADMVRRLLAQPQLAGAILADACGCVVTNAEHQRLEKVDGAHKHIDGWERYRLARIKVFDRLQRRMKSLRSTARR